MDTQLPTSRVRVRNLIFPFSFFLNVSSLHYFHCTRLEEKKKILDYSKIIRVELIQIIKIRHARSNQINEFISDDDRPLISFPGLSRNSQRRRGGIILAAIVFSLKRGDINCEIPKFALEREIRSWKKLTLRRGYVTRACNIIIVSRTGERKHPMTVCSAPLPFPFLFLITAETKWTSTPPETLDLGTDFSSQESVSVFGIAKELPRRNSIRSGI